MSRLIDIVQSLRSKPGYVLMRGLARFHSVRNLVGRSRRLLHGARLRAHLDACDKRMGVSLFPAVDRQQMVQQLSADGLALGLRLPDDVMAEIHAYASQAPCYADRNPAQGFAVTEHAQAASVLGKPLLLAQYFNTVRDCPAIGRLASDPLLQWVAGSYLESLPTFVGANLWWTFAVDALEQDRHRHAHLFHRDVDDFSFFKFFFYLTDVEQGDGGHVCVVASHRRPPIMRPGDRWNLRRYTDAEIERTYARESIVEICGPAGTGFAENTLCVHKGRTPSGQARLLLQLQYAMFDYGAMHDCRAASALRMLT